MAALGDYIAGKKNYLDGNKVVFLQRFDNTNLESVEGNRPFYDNRGTGFLHF